MRTSLLFFFFSLFFNFSALKGVKASPIPIKPYYENTFTKNRLKNIKNDTLPDIFPKKNKSLRRLLWISGGTYALGLVGLNELWYKNNPRGSFRFFNDSQEWQQIDKFGHFYSAFQISRLSKETLDQVGLNHQKARFWGSLTGVLLMTPIEIFDGFSTAYGASWSDLLANTAGSGFALGQYLLWNEIRVFPKYSFHSTSFAQQRPNVLGKNLLEQSLKDYNGQTYWFSVDIDRFSKRASEHFIGRFINIAAGYGAENMVFAEDSDNQTYGLQPYRQFYLGIDFDFTAFKPKKKIWKYVCYALSLIKFPSPTLEYSPQNPNALHWHWLYF